MWWMRISMDSRKMLMQASRNGYSLSWIGDWKSLLTAPYGPMNWSLGLDKQGGDSESRQRADADGRLIAPDEGGLTNFRSPSFDAKTAHSLWMPTRA